MVKGEVYGVEWIGDYCRRHKHAEAGQNAYSVSPKKHATRPDYYLGRSGLILRQFKLSS
jgi:hypothetical protein